MGCAAGAVLAFELNEVAELGEVAIGKIIGGSTACGFFGAAELGWKVNDVKMKHYSYDSAW